MATLNPVLCPWTSSYKSQTPDKGPTQIYMISSLSQSQLTRKVYRTREGTLRAVISCITFRVILNSKILHLNYCSRFAREIERILSGEIWDGCGAMLVLSSYLLLKNTLIALMNAGFCFDKSSYVSVFGYVH